MTEKVFNLDRETNITNNIDAAGKKWEIFQTRGHPMYFARPNPDRSDAIIPELLVGQWTNRQLLQEKITLYVTRNWDESELVAKRNARSNQAATEVATEVPDVAEDMTTEDKEAAILRAVAAENAAIAEAKEA